jgi:putative PIN family toxin of toxin-antitoxin system
MTATAVLDTNVLLDRWVFRDARGSDWWRRIETGELRWLACPRMRSEFAHQLARASLARWQPDAAQALAGFDLLATLQADPPAAGPALRCRDTDDQIFLDLALAHKSKWLLTFDKDLLSLGRRARRLGLEIVQPG